MPKRKNKKKSVGIEGLNFDNCTLSEVNEALRVEIENDKNNWWKYYTLINLVEKKELWNPDYHSLTAWLNDFCVHNRDLGIARAFEIKRAGRIYKEHLERCPDGPSLEEIETSPEHLINLERIAEAKYGKVDATKFDRHNFIDKNMGKVVKGTWGREKLRGILKNEKAKKIQRKKQEEKLGENAEDREAKIEKAVRNEEVANGIKDTIKNFHLWLGEKKAPAINTQRSASTKDYYKMFPEFSLPAPVHTTKSKIVADAVVAENITQQGSGYDTTIHVFEIKASLEDFERDHKMLEYCKFSDYAWLVAPETVLEQIHPGEIPKIFGVLGYRRKGEVLPRLIETPDGFVREETACLNPPGTSRKDEENFSLLPKEYEDEKDLKEGDYFLYKIRVIEERMQDAEVETLLRRFILRDR